MQAWLTRFSVGQAHNEAPGLSLGHGICLLARSAGTNVLIQRINDWYSEPAMHAPACHNTATSGSPAAKYTARIHISRANWGMCDSPYDTRSQGLINMALAHRRPLYCRLNFLSPKIGKTWSTCSSLHDTEL